MRENLRVGDVEARLRQLQAELAEVTLQRDQHRMLRDSWHDQWRRDAGARALAEQRLQRAEELLSRARDLITAWASCHEDPGLERRSEQFLQELQDADGDSGW
jgi:hypothetical protein